MKHIKLKSTQFNQLLKGFEVALIGEDPHSSNVTEHVAQVKELMHFMEQRGLMTVKERTQPIVNEFIKYLETRPNLRRGGLLSNTYINKFITSINNFSRYLDSEQIEAPHIKLKYKKKQERPLPTVLTPEEVQQLYSVTDDTAIGVRDRCMLAIYYGCGMRKSEGLKLNITDINFASGRIFIKKSKNGRERYVMMSPKVQQHIEEYVYSARDMYLPESSPYESLFISERGRPTSGETMAKRIEALWQRVKDRYGSDKHISLHSLRHTLGTQLYKAGMKLEMVGLMLGHRTTESTELYVTLSNLY